MRMSMGPGVAFAAPGRSQPIEDLDEGWSTYRVTRMVGASYRQLDYWCRTNLLRPSGFDAQGSGTRRRYTDRDVLEAAIVVALTRLGLSLEVVRVVMPYVRSFPTDQLVAGVLIMSTRGSYLAGSPMELWDAQAELDGGVVLPIQPVAERIDQAIAAELAGAPIGSPGRL